MKSATTVADGLIPTCSCGEAARVPSPLPGRTATHPFSVPAPTRNSIPAAATSGRPSPLKSPTATPCGDWLAVNRAAGPNPNVPFELASMTPTVLGPWPLADTRSGYPSPFMSATTRSATPLPYSGKLVNAPNVPSPLPDGSTLPSRMLTPAFDPQPTATSATWSWLKSPTASVPGEPPVGYTFPPKNVPSPLFM